MITWNVGRRDLWADLEPYDIDVALLQEARLPDAGSALEVVPGDFEQWRTAGWSPRPWRAAIGRLSERVALVPRPTVALHAAASERDWVVSWNGTIAAADVVVAGRTMFTAISIYAPWEATPSRRGYADGSAHRILSDLSVLMGTRRHRLVVAGDWNILRGYGEYGDPFWKARYDTVFNRAEALGLRFVGPSYPNGRRADPWPDELPADSTCVPTFHHSQQRPATATRQLDFVFASIGLADDLEVKALNTVEEWGPSDHCRILIDVNT
jgi:exonuclease III